MKRYLSIIMLAIAAFVAAPQVSAYNEQIAELAGLLNTAAAENGISVDYDGTNIVMHFPSSTFSQDEVAMLSMVDDLQPLAPAMLSGIAQFLSEEDMQLFGTILSQNNTNLVVRLHLGDTTKDIVITGEDFLKK